MIKRNCKQCGKDFVLSDSEIKFFKDKNLDLPKRCSECRKENKNNSSSKNSNKNENINSNKNDNIKNKDGNSSTTIKNNINHNGKGKTFRNIIIAGLVLVVLLIGKLFNIELNWTDIGTTLENGQSTNVSFQFRNDQLLEDHFLKHGNEFDFYVNEDKDEKKETSYDIKRIDMGIAMCHFELTCKELGIKGKFKVGSPKINDAPNNYKYLITWIKD